MGGEEDQVLLLGLKGTTCLSFSDRVDHSLALVGGSLSSWYQTTFRPLLLFVELFSQLRLQPSHFESLLRFVFGKPLG